MSKKCRTDPPGKADEIDGQMDEDGSFAGRRLTEDDTFTIGNTKSGESARIVDRITECFLPTRRQPCFTSIRSYALRTEMTTAMDLVRLHYEDAHRAQVIAGATGTGNGTGTIFDSFLSHADQT